MKWSKRFVDVKDVPVCYSVCMSLAVRWGIFYRFGRSSSASDVVSGDQIRYTAWLIKCW